MGITNVGSPGNQAQHQAWTEPKLPHQHRLYHVEHRHRINLPIMHHSMHQMPASLLHLHKEITVMSELKKRLRTW